MANIVEADRTPQNYSNCILKYKSSPNVYTAIISNKIVCIFASKLDLFFSNWIFAATFLYKLFFLYKKLPQIKFVEDNSKNYHGHKIKQLCCTQMEIFKTVKFCRFPKSMIDIHVHCSGNIYTKKNNWRILIYYPNYYLQEKINQ